jgi:hypothetical protein
MLIRLIYVLTIVALVALVLARASSAAESPCPSVLDQKLANLQDEPVRSASSAGKCCC